MLKKIVYLDIQYCRIYNYTTIHSIQSDQQSIITPFYLNFDYTTFINSKIR